MFPYACHDALDGLVERLVGAAGLELVGAHLAQQVLECVDHGQAERDADGAAERHLETRVHVVGVLVIVGDDGDVAVAGVVERFAQKRRVVRQTAVADVFAGADGDGMRVPFSAVERGEGFADGHLSWEADVVMNVAFPQLDGSFPTDVKRDGLRALTGERRRHEQGERVRGVRHEDGLDAPVGLDVLDGVGVGQRVVGGCRRAGECASLGGVGCVFAGGVLDGGLARAALVDGLDERAHADAQRPGDVGFVELENKRLLARAFLHEAADLVGKVGVVAAAEADELHVLERGGIGGDDGAGEHALVEVVHDVDAACRQVDVGDAGDGVGRKHGMPHVGEHFGQVVVDERVVVVGAAGKHDGVGSGAASGFDGVRAGLGQQRFERALGFVRLPDGT